jgi:argininosuccinate lyase
MREAITKEMFATDHATDLARGGMPFRDAYRAVAKELGSLAGDGIEASLAARVSPGATADLRLPEMRARLVATRALLGTLGTLETRRAHAAT